MEKFSNLVTYDAPVSSVAFSPNGKLLATAADKTVMVWDLEIGQRISIFPDHEATVTAVAFSNGGKFLATAAGQIMTLWSSETWDTPMHLVKHKSPVTSIDFCCFHELSDCDQPLLAFGRADGVVGVFDVINRKEVTASVHESRVNAVSWSGFPHDAILSTGWYRSIVKSRFSDRSFELVESSRRKGSADFLATPYQPGNGAFSAPSISMLKNDDKGGVIFNRRLNYETIGSSFVSANGYNKIEYGIMQGKLAATESPVNVMSWIGNWPVNFATGHEGGEIRFWGINLEHRSFLMHHLIGWLSKRTVSANIVLYAQIRAHRKGSVTALAYPAISRRGEQSMSQSVATTGGDWLMASGSTDCTVRLWNIINLKSELEKEGTKWGLAALKENLIGSDVTRNFSDVLTLSGLAARKR